MTPPPISSPPTLFFLSGADISAFSPISLFFFFFFLKTLSPFPYFFSPISLPIYKTIFHAAAAASVFCFLSPEPSLLQRTCTARFAFLTFKVMLQHSTWFSITSQHPTPHYTRWHHTRRTKITKNRKVRKTTPHSAKEVDSSGGISLVTNRMSKGENLNLTKYLVLGSLSISHCMVFLTFCNFQDWMNTPRS